MYPFIAHFTRILITWVELIKFVHFSCFTRCYFIFDGVVTATNVARYSIVCNNISYLVSEVSGASVVIVSQIRAFAMLLLVIVGN